MKSVVRIATASTLSTVTLLAAVACADRSTEPGARLKPTAPSYAVAVAEMSRIALQDTDGDGWLELDRVCDVFIGDPAVDPVDGVPQRYEHQVVVDVPAGSRIKIVGAAGMDGKLFTCDAVDRDADGNPILDANGNQQPVIDPVTLHAAKGDAFQINTADVTVDLNGYSITVSPAFGEDPAFENLGVQLAGDRVTLTNNSSDVSKIFGFGHNVDIEALSPTVQGYRYNAAGERDPNGDVYNLETKGGFGIRLSSGTMKIDQVKSVNVDDQVDGQGFEARRISSGFLTVSNSYFAGGAEGAFLREVSGVTLTNNYVSGVTGPGIATRQAISSTARPIKLVGNKVDNSAQGIVWGRDSRNNGGLTISGNTITRYATCGIARSSRNTTIAPLTLASIAAANTFDRTTQQTCTIAD